MLKKQSAYNENPISPRGECPTSLSAAYGLATVDRGRALDNGTGKQSLEARYFLHSAKGWIPIESLLWGSHK